MLDLLISDDLRTQGMRTQGRRAEGRLSVRSTLFGLLPMLKMIIVLMTSVILVSKNINTGMTMRTAIFI